MTDFLPMKLLIEKAVCLPSVSAVIEAQGITPVSLENKRDVLLQLIKSHKITLDDLRPLSHMEGYSILVQDLDPELPLPTCEDIYRIAVNETARDILDDFFGMLSFYPKDEKLNRCFYRFFPDVKSFLPYLGADYTTFQQLDGGSLSEDVVQHFFRLSVEFLHIFRLGTYFVGSRMLQRAYTAFYPFLDAADVQFVCDFELTHGRLPYIFMLQKDISEHCKNGYSQPLAMQERFLAFKGTYNYESMKQEIEYEGLFHNACEKRREELYEKVCREEKYEGTFSSFMKLFQELSFHTISEESLVLTYWNELAAEAEAEMSAQSETEMKDDFDEE